MHISNENFHKNLGIEGDYKSILPKKLISAMLMLALLCSSLAIPQDFHLTASADTNNNADWDFNKDDVYKYADFSPFADNKGTSSADPYTINTAAQLAALAILVNNAGAGSVSVKGINNSSATCSDFQGKYIKLTADIDLGAHQWVPIGFDNTKPFKGNFDGCGYTIKKMHIGSEDLEGAIISANYKYAGLFGYVKADSNVTIQNVNMDASSWVCTSGEFAGGICAQASVNASNSTLAITNCSNSAIITAGSTTNTKAYAGGICAQATATAGTITITNCKNFSLNGKKICATANGEKNTYAYAGGICGQADATTNNGATIKIAITNCSNSATSTSKKAIEATTAAGGICGQATTTNTHKDTPNGTPPQQHSQYNNSKLQQ